MPICKVGGPAYHRNRLADKNRLKCVAAKQTGILGAQSRDSGQLYPNIGDHQYLLYYANGPQSIAQCEYSASSPMDLHDTTLPAC